MSREEVLFLGNISLRGFRLMLVKVEGARDQRTYMGNIPYANAM